MGMVTVMSRGKPHSETNYTRAACARQARQSIGSVLICSFRKLWVTVLIVAFFTIPQIAPGIYDEKAELQPMVNSEGIGVINPSNEIRNYLDFGEDLRLLSIKNDWNSGACIGTKNLGYGVVDGNIRRSRYFAAQQLVLFPVELLHTVSHSDGTLGALAIRPELNIASSGFPDVSNVNWILEGCPNLFCSRKKQRSFYRFNLNPRTFVNTEGFSALPKRDTCYAILSNHLAPHEERYEGIDANCHKRIPSRLLYGFLSGVLAIILGGRISYHLLVKGDDRTDFYGIIGWRFLIPFSFVTLMYGFGALMECVLYFTNPC
jgi:hypothetical protein